MEKAWVTVRGKWVNEVDTLGPKPPALRLLQLPQEKSSRLLCETGRGCRPHLEASLHLVGLKMIFLDWRSGALTMLHSLSC